jgi:MFS family permease
VLIVALGIALMGVSLLAAVPVAIAVVAWGIGGLGIGLAYAPITVTVLGLAPAAEQGRASAQLQLSDTLGTALGAGLGGVLVAAGAAAGWHQSTSLAATFAMTGAVGLLAVVLTRRLPDRRLAAITEEPARRRPRVPVASGPASAAGARRCAPGGRGARGGPGAPGSRRPRRGA